MIKLYKVFCILFISFFCIEIHALTTEQKNYKKVVKAYIEKDKKTLQKIAPKLKNYILYPYVEYYLVNDMRYANKPKIDAYLRKYGNRSIAVRLKSKWLSYLIRNKYYKAASQYSAPKYAYTTRCNILHAKIKLGIKVKYLKNKDLWLTGRSRPDACDPVFSFWKKNESIGMHNYSLRTELALERGNLSFAKRLAVKASKPIQAKVWLADKRRRALFRAKDYPKDGYQLLNRLSISVVNDEVREWKARQFIYHANWRGLLKEIRSMPKRQQKHDIWQYWRARSLARIGKTKEAIKTYRSLATKANYYGFLSADRLSLPYRICHKERKVNGNKLIKKFPALRQAIELYKLDSNVFAGIEWNSAIRRMNKSQKIDASILAGEHGWHEKAIFTLGEMREFTYYKNRFPVKWRKIVMAQAKKRNLSPAYIYGVIRTESSMKTDAISSVGAVGLMQLMPKTAKLISRQYSLKKYRVSELFNPENNIKFGTAYLDKMAKLWDKQFILMTASYNAGPRKVKQWTKSLPHEADRFIELIPYDETRKYVTRVLDYTTMYNWRMYPSVRRIGYRITNINGDNKSFIPARDMYTEVYCKTG